jgi:hypothetical protein
MKKLTFTQAHHLGKLHDELLAAIPALQPTGAGEERRAVMSVSGDGSTLSLGVPDDADEAAIAAVVAAHDPTPPAPPPDPNTELTAAIAAVDTTGIVDPAAKAAVEALRDALLGRTRPGRVAGRPT